MGDGFQQDDFKIEMVGTVTNPPIDETDTDSDLKEG